MSDIQDHITTSTQNLTHYEKILSRSHSNYLAQISIEMCVPVVLLTERKHHVADRLHVPVNRTDANNQINDVLSKLTALGTVLIPVRRLDSLV